MVKRGLNSSNYIVDPAIEGKSKQESSNHTKQQRNVAEQKQ